MPPSSRSQCTGGVAAHGDPGSGPVLHPHRPAASAACKSAGIRIVAINGDKGESVSYIASKLGIVTPQVIECVALANMDTEDPVDMLCGGEVVFAHIATEQKLNIVNALKEMDEVVVVTGDGVE